MWFGAMLTILGLGMLFWKFGTTFRQAILGHDIFADITVTVFFVWLFATTGTISGMMMAISAGVIVSIMLLVGKKLFTSRTIRIHRDGYKFSYNWIVRKGLIYNWRSHYAAARVRT
jgi:hypothetical protein